LALATQGGRGRGLRVLAVWFLCFEVPDANCADEKQGPRGSRKKKK